MSALNATHYGQFTNLVQDAGSIFAAVLALIFTWRGRARWEPSEQDIPEGSEKIAGLISVAVIAIVWVSFHNNPLTPSLRMMLIVTVIVVFVCLLIYGWLVAVYTFDKVEIDSAGNTQTSKIIGSWELTPQAKYAIAASPATRQEVLAGMGYDSDKVWPRESRAFAKALFVVSYIGLIVSGTSVVAISSIIVGGRSL